MLYQNTDIQFDVRYTSYPFTHQSTKLINGVYISNNLFLSVGICVAQPCIDIHITQLSYQRSIVYIHITDVQAKLHITCPLVQGSQIAFFLNQYGTPCGMLQCSPELYANLLAVINSSQSNRLSVLPSAFVFLPECISVAQVQGIQQIAVNGQSVSIVQLKRNIVYQILSDSSIQISMYPDDNQEEDAVKLRTINGVFAGDKHVVIKHNTLSDLRVVTKNTIQLMGVADV